MKTEIIDVKVEKQAAVSSSAVKVAHEFNEDYDDIESAMIDFAKAHIQDLFEKIKHGDKDHQDWLWNEMNEFSKNIK